MCSSLFVDIQYHCCIVSGNHNTRVVYVLYGFLRIKKQKKKKRKKKKRPLFPEYWYGAGIGLPSSDHERIVSSVLDELPIRNGWHPCKGMHWDLEDGWTFPEWSSWCPSNISNEIKSYCLLELDDPVGEYEVSRQIRDTLVAVVNEICLVKQSLLLHWVCPKEKGKFVLKLESELEIVCWSDVVIRCNLLVPWRYSVVSEIPSLWRWIAGLVSNLTSLNLGWILDSELFEGNILCEI